LGKTEVRALAELIRAEDRREFDEPLFRAHFGSVHPELRRFAVRAAGRVRDPDASAFLLDALADSAAAVRSEAAFALGQLGDSTAHIIGALASRALATEEEVAPRVEAIAALGKLRSVGARVAIEFLLERATAAGAEERPPAPVVAEALLAVWKFRRAAGLTDPLVPLSRSADSELRWRATYALMRLGDPGTITALLDRRHDEDPLVRVLALRALRPAVVDSAGLRAAAIVALAEATLDSHPHVRINALRALASYELPEHSGTLGRALNDENANVALAAAEALSAAGGAAATSALERLARDPATPLALRSAALGGVLRNAPEQGLPVAHELARADQWLTRLYAARALAVPDTRAVALLTELAHDHDARVAATALGGLAELPSEFAAGTRRLFVEQLGAADVRVRAAALQGLTRGAAAADLPVFLDAYERATFDQAMDDAARAAITALGTLASQGLPVQRAFFHRFERSPNPIVRREVREKIGAGDWGPVYPVATERELAFYEKIVEDLVLPELTGAPRPRAIIHTAGGKITLEFAAADAPLTVHNFMTLADQGYFAGHRWHRVVPNFVLQDGDPRGDGSGGPGYAIRDEINPIRYLRGTLGMALDGADTGGSQFFITHAPQPHLDGGYTVFGEVVEGMAVADRVTQDDPIQRIDIVRPATAISAAAARAQ
jgi:cyclophilin family peptidyl-prolyl cis-trans isomerase/HEAT repeat protein